MPLSPNLKAEKFTLTTKTQGTPLICTMKRYTRASGKPPGPKEPAAIILLGHGTGFPKETWEPTIEDLFGMDDAIPIPSQWQSQSQSQSRALGALRVREAWALDCQNHGEAAIVNGETLSKDPSLLTIYDLSDAFASLYNSGLLGPLDPEFDKVILAGHSAGSVGVTLATSWFNPPNMIPFAGLILIDSPIFSLAMKGRENDMYKLVREMTPLRKDIWASKEDAIKWMRKRLPFSTWDRRVFDTYTEHGLQPLPTPYYPDKKEGVTLSAHRSGENIAFTGEIFAYHALFRLSQICDYLPVHLIYGAENDMFDREQQDSIVDPKEHRNFASVTRIKGAGHLVPQEAPLKLALAIFAILRKIPYSDGGSKL